MSPKSRGLSKLRFVTLLLMLPALLSLTQCASSPPPSALTAACGSIACTSTTDCTSVANFPVCGKVGSAVCHSVSHECTWALKNDSSCPCLERDVRLCNVSPSVPGVQICTKNGAGTGTYWATCTACATCT